MRISGTAELKADPQQVFDAFHDPAVLARCLPGCESLTEIGPHRYAMTVTAGVAAVKGTYDGTVALHDPNPPEGFTLKASGAGSPGTVDADVVVRLAAADGGGTALAYDADATVGGMLGGVGQRMLTGVTRKMAGQFFTAVDDDIAGVRPVPIEQPVLTRAPGAPAGAPVYAGRRAVPAAEAGVGRGNRDFGWGVLTGGVVALAGVIVGWAIGGR
ncbi:carbon monoxide dehydrogenase subunit G [Pedococcus sp. NPDC057267]|uniref:SRPBCC family protein n=1 Tax=Pedococcus sp. NPDC057267 TaxID=3346077 RepID=UPI00362EB859